MNVPAAATKAAANDKQDRVTLCKHILRPPLANDRLKILDDGVVRLEFKRPWSDGTTSIELGASPSIEGGGRGPQQRRRRENFNQ